MALFDRTTIVWSPYDCWIRRMLAKFSHLPMISSVYKTLFTDPFNFDSSIYVFILIWSNSPRTMKYIIISMDLHFVYSAASDRFKRMLTILFSSPLNLNQFFWKLYLSFQELLIYWRRTKNWYWGSCGS